MKIYTLKRRKVIIEQVEIEAHDILQAFDKVRKGEGECVEREEKDFELFSYSSREIPE